MSYLPEPYFNLKAFYKNKEWFHFFDTAILVKAIEQKKNEILLFMIPLTFAGNTKNINFNL